MKKRLLLVILPALALTALVTTGVYLYRREPSSLGKDVILTTLPSAVLGEAREIVVHLPQSYHQSPTRRYPVVYVLDGSSQEGHTAQGAALMARIGVMPEVLVVGLPNTSGPNRARDYTPPFMRREVDQPDSPRGAGDRFLAFVKAEVMPRIEREYRTAPFRVLAGHSRGGLLVLYSLISDPGLFDARLAFSAPVWREDEVTVSKLREALASSAGTSTFLYLSVGDQETERMIRGHHDAVATLQQHAPRGLRWRADLTAGADHQSNAELSTPVALRALYLDWQPTETDR